MYMKWVFKVSKVPYAVLVTWDTNDYRVRNLSWYMLVRKVGVGVSRVT